MALPYTREATRLRPLHPVLRRRAPGWLVGPPVALGAPGSQGVRHERVRGSARRCCLADASRDRAIRYHLEEGLARFRWRICLPVAVTAKMLQFPRRSMLQKLPEAVFGTHYRAGRHGLRLARPHEEEGSGDAPLAPTHYARHQSG